MGESQVPDAPPEQPQPGEEQPPEEQQPPEGGQGSDEAQVEKQDEEPEGE